MSCGGIVSAKTIDMTPTTAEPLQIKAAVCVWYISNSFSLSSSVLAKACRYMSRNTIQNAMNPQPRKTNIVASSSLDENSIVSGKYPRLIHQKNPENIIRKG